jgi:hypothetical protein
MVGEKGMVEKAKNIVFDNESGLYWSKYFGDWWLVHELDAKEAAAVGLVPKDHEFYSNENRKIMAERKRNAEDGRHGRTPAPAKPEPPKSSPLHKEAPPMEPPENPASLGDDIVPVSITEDIVRPVVSPERVLKAFQQLQEIKRKLLTKDDYVEIGTRTFVRKSGLRKIRVVFNISMKLLREERKELDEGHYEYTAYVRAQAPNGVFVDAVSSCASTEPFGERQKEGTRKLFPEKVRDTKEVKPEMYVFAVRGMAQTRAYNRAISDLVGGGLDVMEEEEKDGGQ